MKRLHSSDSETQSVFDDEFQCMLEEEYSGNGENILQMGQSEKKRRLSVVQVKALEKNFELENKLEPERKVKLAQELGLQPRQVAVWFQNRRARWKTKQLEKDYGLLKNQFDSLRHNFDSLRRDNDALLQEINKMKAKINGEEVLEEDNNNLTATTTTEISNISAVKEEETSLPERNLSSPSSPSSPPLFLEHSTCFNYRRSFTDLRELLPNSATVAAVDGGPSDSCDSSAVINDESSSDNGRLTPPATVTDGNFFKFVKMEHTTEDHDDFLSGEEACGFFSDEQPPSLHWWT